MKYQYIVFDFDGTLFDTGSGIIKTARQALEHYNIPVNENDDMKFFIGPPLLDSFQRYQGVDENMAGLLVEKYREEYPKGGLYDCIMYDGVKEALSLLKNNSVKIAIGSSKPKMFIESLLVHYDMEELFDYISAVEPNNAREPKSSIISRALTRIGCNDYDDALMVGDRYFDIDGANEIGIHSAGVLHGYGNEQEFEEHNATYIVKDINELLKLISQ